MFPRDISEPLPPIDRRRSFLYTSEAPIDFGPSFKPARDWSASYEASSDYSFPPRQKPALLQYPPPSMYDTSPFSFGSPSSARSEHSFGGFHLDISPSRFASPTSPASPPLSYSDSYTPASANLYYSSTPSPLAPAPVSRLSKSRPTFSVEQTLAMEALLARATYPSYEDIENASRETGLVGLTCLELSRSRLIYFEQTEKVYRFNS
jgi:hypothetical protein